MKDTETMFAATQNQLTELKESVLNELHQLKVENEVLRQAVSRLQKENNILTNIKTSTKSYPDMFYVGLLVVGFVVGMLGVVYNLTM